MKTKLIAEIGLNHGGDFEKAKKMCVEAHKAGAHFAKFQTYSSEKRALSNSGLFQLLKKCELTREQHRELKQYCDLIGIGFLSTPFDEDSLKFLVFDLGLDAIKIASFYLSDRMFLDQVNDIARTRDLTVYMSTGMSSAREVVEALDHLKDVGQLHLLHCVSAYPTPPSQAHLAALRTLAGYSTLQRPLTVGYSNHVKAWDVPAYSVLVGAQTVECHFMLEGDTTCVDAPVSLTPFMFRNMVIKIEEYEKLLGGDQLAVAECEQPALTYKRKS